MKLIIDIPDEDYKLICKKKENAIIAHDTCRRIANGTPFEEELEKIKSEIFWSELDNREYITYWKALNHCCEIVDDHISKLKGGAE